MLDARSLRYFAEVVGSGSFSRAAENLGVSQPALSKCIRQLEEQLRVRLLDRNATGVAPTPYGKMLYRRASSITAEISRAESEVRALAHGEESLVRVGVLPSQMPYLLPKASLHLLKSQMDLRLRVIERTRGDLMSGLLRSEFDLIVSVVGADEAPPIVSSHVLFRDRPSIILRIGHPLSGKSRTQLQQLGDYPWIVPPVGAVRGNNFEAILKSVGIKQPPKNTIECYSHAFLKGMVLQSDCVGLLPNNDRTPEEEAGLLQSIDIEQGPFTRTIGLLYRNDYPQTNAALTVTRAIKRAAEGRQERRPR